MTPTSTRSASRSKSNGSEGGANPPGVALPPLPARTRAEARIHFRRPFDPRAVKWKVQSVLRNDRGLLVGYVDARLVAERLDLVTGGDWEDELIEFAGGIKCRLTVMGKTREDVGKGGFEKASASDALKRAAVLFGIGASLYATPTRILSSTEKGTVDGNNVPTLRRVKDRKDKTQLWITDPAERWLREQYSIWLLGDGEARFGESFDHGDATGTVGDAAAEGIHVDQGEPSDDARKQEITEAYKAMIEAGVPKSKFTKGKFDAQLRQADTTKKLDELEAKVKELADA